MGTCPTKCGSIGKEYALVAVSTLVRGVLLRKWDLVVAASARSKGNWEGAALVAVLLRVHEKRVARIEGSEVVDIAGFLCRLC
jgi:hypothetical protein